MQNLRTSKSLLKYLAVFVMGSVVGGGLVFQFGWSIIVGLMGVEAQTGYRAVEHSVMASDFTRVLSHLRLAENKEAINQAELRLDSETINAAAALNAIQDAQTKKTVKTQLGFVKRYRKIYPSQTEFMSQINQILAGIPDLPEPKQKLPDEKLTALGRLYQRHQNP